MDTIRKPFIIPLFIPHLGCPHRCIFCDQKTVAGDPVVRPTSEQVLARIHQYLAYKGQKRGATEVAFYGGNFLGLPNGYRRSLLRAVVPFVNRGAVQGIRFSTRPDSITATTLTTVTDHAVRAVEIGAQSMDDRVLTRCRRGHTAGDTQSAVTVLRTFGIPVGIQMMLGLPGDTTSSMKETGRRVVALKPDFVRIYPTVVVRGTALERWYGEGRYIPLGLEEAIDMTKWLYRLFEKSQIAVIRMGLHATETLTTSQTVVAGPFHPAFGHLVHSAILLDRAVDALKAQGKKNRSVRLHVHPRYTSRLIGDRRQNLDCLCRTFSLYDLRVLPDATVPPGEVIVGSFSQEKFPSSGHCVTGSARARVEGCKNT